MYLEQSPDEHLVPYQTPLYTQLQLLPVPSPLMSRDTKYIHAWIQEFLPYKQTICDIMRQLQEVIVDSQ